MWEISPEPPFFSTPVASYKTILKSHKPRFYRHIDENKMGMFPEKGKLFVRWGRRLLSL
jgi:hypothetical protein